MSAAAAVADATPKSGGKKKLLVIIAAAVLLLGGGGTAALVVMKKRAAEAAAAEEAADEGAAPAKAAGHGAKAHDKDAHPPAFVPLDPFVVNLADHDADRYAQVGLVLQVPDEKAGEEIKGYLPAIRNNILMLLAHQTSTDLLGREGKERLAREIRRDALKAMGYEVEDDEAPAADAHAAEGEAAKPKKKAKKKPAAEEAMPIVAVQFSSFIIQ